MSKYRRAAKIDANQPEIVEHLKSIPGVTVQVGMDDILVGYDGRTFWFELKTPDTVSKRTGEIRESEIKSSQKDLREYWRGHYQIVHCVNQIKEAIGVRERES